MIYRSWPPVILQDPAPPPEWLKWWIERLRRMLSDEREDRKKRDSRRSREHRKDRKDRKNR